LSLFLLLAPPPPISTLFPYTTLFRSRAAQAPHFAHVLGGLLIGDQQRRLPDPDQFPIATEVGGDHDLRVIDLPAPLGADPATGRDRKSTRLNSSHVKISYAVVCLKKK